VLKLYGFPVSNYANMVNLALLEKGIPFEYVMTYPNQSPELLAKSPLGKVPFLETPQGFINETNVILEYLEDLGEGIPLLPAERYERARVRMLMKEMELYVELPARDCFHEALFGLKSSVPEAIQAKSRDRLLAGFAALKRHGKFAPYLAGDTFTLADIFFLCSVELAAQVARNQFGLDMLADFPAARELLARLNERPHVRAVAVPRDRGMPGFIAAVQEKYKGTYAASAQ
jgi:glutathione S-transferase